MSRNRDQDILLKSNLFNHIFVHSDECKSRIIQNQWAMRDKLTVMLNGFNPKLHYKMDETKDIDILFVGSILPRRKKILRELQTEFNIRICKAFGKEIIQSYLTLKNREMKNYRKVEGSIKVTSVTKWEKDNTLDC